MPQIQKKIQIDHKITKKSRTIKQPNYKTPYYPPISVFSRLNDFGLKVALDVLDGQASGEMFWDDGESQGRRSYQFIGRANMIQFMGRRNQIGFFVRFKADRSLKCLHYDPYVYHVVYQ